jgi:adenylate kinase
MAKYTLMLLGAVGAGKGTQAQRLSQQLRIPQISTGDILRAEAKSESELGKRAGDLMNRGELVPDEVIIELVRNRLQADDAVRGAIFDGFPRTIPQAEALDSLLKDVGLPEPRVISIEVPPDVIVERLSSRRQCTTCGAVFTLPRDEAAIATHRCPNGTPNIILRDDDRPETVTQRLCVYHEKTAPLIGYYKKLGNLRAVSGIGTEDEVFARILIAMDPDLS